MPTWGSNLHEFRIQKVCSIFLLKSFIFLPTDCYYLCFILYYFITSILLTLRIFTKIKVWEYRPWLLWDTFWEIVHYRRLWLYNEIRKISRKNFNRRVQNVTATIHVEEILRRLNEIVTSLKCHIHINYVQHAKFNSLKSNLQGNEILIEIDYSENYANQVKIRARVLILVRVVFWYSPHVAI